MGGSLTKQDKLFYKLYEAFEAKDNERVAQIIKKPQFEVNRTDTHGRTALHSVASAGHVVTTELLIERKANVNQCTLDATSPLFFASRNGHVDIVDILLKNKAFVNGQTRDGVSALYIASQNGFREVVELLLKHKAEPNMEKEFTYSTAIHIASTNGHWEVVEKLVEYQADVNRQRNDGATPLCIAAENGRVDAVAELIHRRANPALERHDQRSPIYLAASRGYSEVVSMLLKHGVSADFLMKGVSPISVAAQKGHEDVVKILLDKKADINLCRPSGESPLFLATQTNQHKIVKILLSADADVELKRADGATVYEIAKKNKREKCVRLLKKHKRDSLTSAKRKQNSIPSTPPPPADYSTIARTHVIQGGPTGAYPDCETTQHNALKKRNSLSTGSEPSLGLPLSPNQLPSLDLPPHPNRLPSPGSSPSPSNYVLYPKAHKRQNHYSKRSEEKSFKAIILEDVLSDVEDLGEGAFSFTFKARWQGKDVVLKRSKTKPGGDELSELMLLNNLPPHPNVIAVLAICTNFRGTFAIVTEFQDGGDLQTHIVNSQGKLSDGDKIRIVIGMALGVQHLHKHSIIHRDIATRNFLLSSAGEVLISDFGLSCRIDEAVPEQTAVTGTAAGARAGSHFEGRSVSGSGTIYDSQSPIPWRWCAPETLSKRVCNKASDIWMFGVCIWEVVAQDHQPFGKFENPIDLFRHLESSRVCSLNIPGETPKILSSLISRCCEFTPADRVDINDIVSALESVL